jgi:dipeptidyl aminopeptidase/acylaminoacyl peptidase|tara:strand:+ start:171 stop:1076 length:906 start_codon:yes stop_codon:yes gene_type:complete
MKNTKKLIAISAASVTGIVIASFLAVAWILSSNIMHPTFVCSEEHFIYCGDPSQLDLSFEDISIQVGDGHTLSGWYIPAEASDKAVIFIHGHGADRHEGMRWFKAVHQAGFNILAFDLRNQGKSAKSFSTMGYFEKRDVIRALDYLQQQKQIESIGIFGTSMGAATSIMAMVDDSRIAAGVFEAGWANLDDLYSEIIEQHMGLPSYPLLPLTTWMLEQRTGMEMAKLNPEDMLADIAPRPVFIIHCSGDNLIGFSHGERNYAAAKKPKEFWKSPCQMHARAWQSDPEYIEQRVTNYFTKYL